MITTIATTAEQHTKAPSRRQLVLELFLLFVCTPSLLILPIHIGIKLLMVFTALFWVTWVSKKAKLFNKSRLLGLEKKALLSSILLRWITFAAISTLLMAWLLPEKLFDVVLQMPLLWIGICLFYALFSVYPQEFIYRVFFFYRYQPLVTNPHYFLLLNAVLFCFAHLVFLNALVFVLTFAGGLLFAHSYQKYQSLMVTSIEHALYGLWLYTLGMGAMLAFPGPG